jgi:hypothetical protein
MTQPAGHRRSVERWGGMTISEQLAHVGSEVERVFRAREAGQEARAAHAMVRALELFDLTATDARWQGSRRREVLRTRETFCALVHDIRSSGHDTGPLSRYFLAAAVAARHQADRAVEAASTKQR